MQGISYRVTSVQRVFSVSRKRLTFSINALMTAKRYGSNDREFFYAFFCPGTMTTHVESINSDLQRGLDRHLRRTQH